MLVHGTNTMESETAVEWGITVSMIREYKCLQKDFNVHTTYISLNLQFQQPNVQCYENDKQNLVIQTHE